jgi:hypothetical protein
MRPKTCGAQQARASLPELLERAHRGGITVITKRGRPLMRYLVVSGVLALVSSPALAAPPPLPEGDQGIAAGYPNDEGIDGDPAVYFVEDFESYTDAQQLWDRWDNFFQQDQTQIVTDTDNVWAGAQSIELTLPQQDVELSNGLVKFVAPEKDVLFLRYYSKFLPPYDVVGSSHNGSWISSHYEDENGQATPGIPADGTNKYLVAYENWRGEPETASPGLLNVYVYHPLQRDDYGDHFFPSGLVMPNTSELFDFGPDFVPRPEIIQELDRWYCYEVMVQANTPGQLDGRIAFWLDGALAADFHNLRLRDIDTLTIDRFGVGFHAGSNPNGEQKKWYDNIVAADAYIGPMFVPGGGDTGADESGSASASDGATSAGGEAGESASAGETGGPGSGPSTASGGSDDGQGTGDDETKGCGCTAVPHASVAWAVCMLALARPRRRRRNRRR